MLRRRCRSKYLFGVKPLQGVNTRIAQPRFRFRPKRRLRRFDWVAVDGRHLSGVTLPDGTYSARGAGGHYILVIPAYDTVIVHRVNTDLPDTQVTDVEFGHLVKLILDAHQKTGTEP